jgi:hypothetical protein
VGPTSTVPGPPNVLSIAGVTTLDPGEPATAVIGGTSPAQTLALGIPRGFTGASTVEARYFESRAAVLGATIDASIDRLLVGGYLNEGDGGWGHLRRRSGAPTVPTSKVYAQSLDGAWWEIEPIDGTVRIEQTGGKADWNGSTGTDNYQPLMDLIGYTQFDPSGNTAANTSPIIQLGFGKYMISQTIKVWDIVYIRGAAGHLPDAFGGGAASQFHFTNTSGSWFVFFSNNAGNGGSETGGPWPFGQNPGTAQGSRCEGFTCHNASGVLTYDPTRHGFNIRCSMTCVRVGVYAAAGYGFYIHAVTGHAGEHNGNANGWFLDNCYAHEVRGHSLAIAGIDANGGCSIKFTTHGVGGIGGCGIFDGSSLGNTHIQPQITGYGNLGVHYLGKHYQLISSASGIGAATTPGTNDQIWYYLRDSGVNASFPEWSAANNYDLLTIPIFIFSIYSQVIGSYIEGANVLAHGAAAPLGGVGGWTRYTPTYGTGQLYGASFANMGTSGEYLTHGLSVTLRVGGPNPVNGYGASGGPAFLTWNKGAEGDGVWGSLGYLGKDIYWQPVGHAGNPNRYVMRFTTPSTDIDYGGGAGVDNTARVIFRDFGLADATAFSSPSIRVFGLRDAQPSTVGQYIRGERYLNSSPTAAGSVNEWVCITTGVIADGPWSAGAVGGGTVVSTTSGRFYRAVAFGASSIEPSHMSGTQTLADGVTWIYLGNSAPAFVLDALVVKQTSAYSVANVVTDRSFDANATTTDELADVLGTLIADLKLAGVLT